MTGRNQAMEIFVCIQDHGPIAAEEVATRTGWVRHVVNVAIEEMAREGMVERQGQTSQGEPLWRSTAANR